METTPEFITELKPNEIFVFGSNENGYHGGGAARIACERFGAEWGISNGHTGQTYAIPTLDRGMEKVEPEMLQIHLEDFAEYVRKHQELKFYLTKIGCGIAGWDVKEIKKMFWKAFGYSQPENLVIPEEFLLTEEDFILVKGTINRTVDCHIGQVHISNAPMEVERMINEDSCGNKWRMDFHSKLHDEYDEYDRIKDYCWVIKD